MERIFKTTMVISMLSVIVLASGYFVDHHRCKQINYERAGYELPSTFLLSAKQCLEAANSVRLRSYARNI